MEIILNRSSMVPVYEQLMNCIREGILQGEYAPGEALPSVRSLAAQLKISALTVKKTYDALEAEGLLVTVHGKGSYVSENMAALLSESRRREAENALADAVALAKRSDLSADEIRQILEILLEEE